MSVVAIRSWSEIRQKEKRVVWEESLKRRREKKRGKESAAKGDEDEGKGKKRKAEDGKAVDGESKEVEKEGAKLTETVVKVEEVSRLPGLIGEDMLTRLCIIRRNPKSRLTNHLFTNSPFSKLFQRLVFERSDMPKRSHYSGELFVTLSLLSSDRSL